MKAQVFVSIDTHKCFSGLIFVCQKMLDMLVTTNNKLLTCFFFISFLFPWN